MTTPKPASRSGFTLIELMVAMFISTVVIGLIVATLFSQQKNHVTQDALVDMQQSMRAAFEVMGSDLKMAGYDPTGNAGATFLVADRSELQLQMDLNGDGDFTNIGPPVTPDTGELIRYALTNDADRDGVADGTPCDLGRELDGSGLQVLAENIDSLNFVYFDRNGTVLPTPVADRSQISSVQVTIIARSGRTVPVLFIRHHDTTVYHNRQGATVLSAPNDDFRRFAIMHEFKCRNLQLN
jgi:type IV pilus assembly protein PilW